MPLFDRVCCTLLKLIARARVHGSRVHAQCSAGMLINKHFIFLCCVFFVVCLPWATSNASQISCSTSHECSETKSAIFALPFPVWLFRCNTAEGGSANRSFQVGKIFSKSGNAGNPPTYLPGSPQPMGGIIFCGAVNTPGPKVCEPKRQHGPG